MDKQLLGAFIAERRKQQGMTQAALAQALHVTDKAVSKWERGLSYPDVTLLQPLADVFRLKVDDLLTCRSEESEVHMANNSPSPQREQANGSPAVQSVLTISAENTQRQKRRQRRIAAIAALVIALSRCWQSCSTTALCSQRSEPCRRTALWSCRYTGTG